MGEEGYKCYKCLGLELDNFSVSEQAHVRAPGGGTAHAQRGVAQYWEIRTGLSLGIVSKPFSLLGPHFPHLCGGMAEDTHRRLRGTPKVQEKRETGNELPRKEGVPGIAPAPGPTRTRKTEVRAANPKRPPGTASLHRAQYQLGEGGSVRGSCPMITGHQG